jgi:hypothetical protein
MKHGSLSGFSEFISGFIRKYGVRRKVPDDKRILDTKRFWGSTRRIA